MAQEELKKSLLEAALDGLDSSEVLEDVEEVEEATEVTGVDETKVYRVWEEDEEEDQDADEDDGADVDVDVDIDGDVDEVEVDADDADDDMEDEAEEEAEAEEEDEEVEEGHYDEEEEDEESTDEGHYDEDEEEVEEDEESDDMEEMEQGDSEEEDGIEGTEEPDDDVDDAINQIKKTITAAAVKRANDEINAAYNEDTMKEDIEALCAEDDSLTEDFKKKVSTIFEAAVSSKVRERVVEIAESYVDYVNEEVNSLHEGLIDKIDSYLTYVAEQWMEKNEIPLTNVLRTEIAESFMSSMKSTFLDHYIEMPEGKTDMFDEISQQNSELSESVKEKDEELGKLSEQIVELKKESIILKLSEGLASTQSEKFVELTKDIGWEDEASFTKKAKIVRESYFNKKTKTVKQQPKSKPENTNTVVIKEEIKEEETSNIDPLMASYIKASTKLQDEAF